MSSVADGSLGARARGRVLRAPFAGTVAAIVLVAVLLAGVVAVNVIVLRLNVRYDELGRQRAQLQADVAQLEAQLSSASANARIESLGRTRLGLVPVEPEQTEYVRLDRP